MTASHINWRSHSFVRTAVVLGVLALGVSACSSGSGGTTPPAANGSSTNGGSRQQQQQANNGNGTPKASGGGSKSTVGEFSVAFAECMRAHGMTNFPNPDGQPGQLFQSGVIGSAPFQNAVNGPCKSLAPPAWVSNGPGGSPLGSNG
jgi:hypothetical protein